ncbi:asparagine synthetase [glutamine-hydrolyzing]-like [Pecten maximus]|uniref:asparagine synthetase [glutamine-hydrolyzing]-like n=1 Tax=Pecten maximus TaxID=6579 RepID=UPI001458C679|nr:asparagine synthetase [glutamine-hydrolyzing]-like [Pecten maximus]
MCGIWAIFGSTSDLVTLCNAASKIAHRGPDAFRLESVYQFPSCCLGFHRLAILDADHGMQPMRVFRHPNVWLIYNGEIYNHIQLRQQFDFKYATHCDGESIIHLYARGGIEFAARHLDGVFAFCLLDTASRKVYLGRDSFGVKPLFRILKEGGILSACSELKGLMDIVKHQSKDKIQHVLPGHVETYRLDSKCRVSLDNIKQFNEIGSKPFYNADSAIEKDVKASIRTLLRSAVSKRMMAERRIGCLLSGGLDSSLVTALLVELAKERKLSYPIQTFTIGMQGGTDIMAARKVAEHLGTEHHEILFTPEEAVAAIENVIYYLESYDIVSVRGSAGMYLLCKYIKEKTDTTVILSGEGADEVAQGYIYFHKAPSIMEADMENRRLCKDLSMFDVRRVDRMSAAFGLEVRVPFLDHTFSSYYLSLDPSIKVPVNGVEKYLLRSAFDETDLLPREILWRPKEILSDGLSSKNKSLYEILQDFADEKLKNLDLDQCIQQYPHNPPISKESLHYRRIFESFYPGQGHVIPYFWMPKWSSSSDPSARTLDNYKQ